MLSFPVFIVSKFANDENTGLNGSCSNCDIFFSVVSVVIVVVVVEV